MLYLQYPLKSPTDTHQAIRTNTNAYISTVILKIGISVILYYPLVYAYPLNNFEAGILRAWVTLFPPPNCIAGNPNKDLFDYFYHI